MGLAEKLSDVDHALSRLGAVPSDLSQRIAAQWGGRSLDAIDQELQALSAGVTLVDRPSPAVSVRPAASVSAAPSFVAEPAEAVEQAPTVASLPPLPASTALVDVVNAPESAGAESAFPEIQTATPSFAPPFGNAASVAPGADNDAPFVPTLPSTPPPTMDAEGLVAGPRRLSMSEPPLSEPPAASLAPPADLDPFEGKPAPIPLPQRAASVWPMAPAPKRTPSKTIRTSAAPPPPLPPNSMRPRSMHPFDAPVRRPSDTPDPFAPLNRASSRPPAGLDADQLFGGISSSPPFGEAQAKVSAPPAPKVPSRAPQAAPVVEDAGDDDFELLVDDEMMEIDVEEENT